MDDAAALAWITKVLERRFCYGHFLRLGPVYKRRFVEDVAKELLTGLRPRPRATGWQPHVRPLDAAKDD